MKSRHARRGIARHGSAQCRVGPSTGSLHPDIFPDTNLDDHPPSCTLLVLRTPHPRVPRQHMKCRSSTRKAHMSQYTEDTGPLFLQPVNPNQTAARSVEAEHQSSPEPFDYTSIFSSRGA